MSRSGAIGIAVALLVLVAPVAPATAAGPAPAPPPDRSVPAADSPKAGAAAEGRLLVRFEEGSTPAVRALARALVAGRTLRRLDLVPGLELVATRLPVDQAIARLRAQRGVVYAVPDMVIAATDLPDDPMLPALWGLSQASDVDIDAPEAWGTSTGAGVVVAVLDSGVKPNHPDLAANLWTNPGEIGANGIDDDGNGYVDDVWGWDFVDDDNLPDDMNGHGTHVAGTIAAVGNNGIGVIGVAPGATVLPLRILDVDGDGFVSDAIRALDYAWRAGARVSNHSWGFTGGQFQPIIDAIEAAGQHGHLVVAAAGNAGVSTDATPFYPASIDLPGILSVAAVDSAGGLATTSNWGTASVDLGAPGAGIVSTGVDPVLQYGAMSGTSMAAPHVAGVAALLLAQHPGWTGAEVRARILATVTPLASLDGRTASGGMVDAGAAVAASPDLAPSVTITSPSAGSASLPGAMIAFVATAVDPEDGDVTVSLQWSSDVDGAIGSGPSVTRADLGPGWHRITARASDSAGHTPTASIRVLVGPQIGEIAQDGGVGSIGLTVTPEGIPFVAWEHPTAGTEVAHRSGGSWTTEHVSSAYIERAPELATDASGEVHLVTAREWTNSSVFADPGIMAVTRGPDGWAAQRVSDSCGDDDVGCIRDWTPTLAGDAGGRMHAAWVGVPWQGPAEGYGLWYGVDHANGSWSTTRILAESGIQTPDIAIGPGNSVHIVFRRTSVDGGIWDASNETGSWVLTRVVESDGAQHTGRPRVVVGPGGDLDVAYGSSIGVRIVRRTAGAWGSPITISDQSAMDLDLARHGATLHLIFGMMDGSSTVSGMAYATSSGGVWTLETLDVGQDQAPRIAVDAAGSVHMAYVRSWPATEVRHVTGTPGVFVTDIVHRSFGWGRPAYAVDAAGVQHVAVARFGHQPGVWYGVNAGAGWTLERVSTIQVDGDVGLAVKPDGTAAIAWGEFYDADNLPLADRATRVAVGTPGSWARQRIADDTVTSRHAIAFDQDGHLHLAFGFEVGAYGRLSYATNASGTWVNTLITPVESDIHSRDPSIAIDSRGKVHLAYERTAPNLLPKPQLALMYTTNTSGSWVRTTVAGGVPFNWQPVIALDGADRPRIAYWRTDTGVSPTVRLARFTGSTWTDGLVADGKNIEPPAYAIDASGNDHILYSRGGYDYAVCDAPLCPDYPGLRYWTNAHGSALTTSLTAYGDDTLPAIGRGHDGSISGAFIGRGRALSSIRLVRPMPGSTMPITHLAPAGTGLGQGGAVLTVAADSRGAEALRLETSVGGGPFAAVGSPAASVRAVLTVTPSSTTTRRFRVVPLDSAAAESAPAYGPTFRVVAKSEAASPSLVYRGTWTTAVNASCYGGKARYTRSSTASVRFTFTGSEVAWIATRGPTRGAARLYVDGRYIATVNLAGTTFYRRVAFRQVLATGGTHTLTIRPTGSGRIDVDGFLVFR
jgi:subtilisin family serine protease